MGSILAELFGSETELDVKASEMYGLMREAVKAEFLLNAAKCDVPNTYARQIATGEKEDAEAVGTPEKETEQAAGQDVRSGSGSVGIIRKHEQRVEWIDIQDIIRKGHAGVSLPPGTEINFTLKNGEPASVVVVGVDHYEKGDCVFWFRKIIGRHYMNSNGTNKGGFPDSDMQEYLNNYVFALLPDELQSVIALHETFQKIEGEDIGTQGFLFLMSMYEGRGSNDFAEYNGTDKQFPYFENRINRIAYENDGGTVWYWTADPSAAYTKPFCCFNGNGGSYNYGAENEGGVAPLFVIK